MLISHIGTALQQLLWSHDLIMYCGPSYPLLVTRRSSRAVWIVIIIIIIKYREKGIMPVSPAHYNKQLH